jgi:F0F1-type ATP synthase membrane subunit b/b'
MPATAALALIQSILALVPTAIEAYGEIRSDLNATTQAEVDAAIASAKAALASISAQADADLDAASKT